MSQSCDECGYQINNTPLCNTCITKKTEMRVSALENRIDVLEAQIEKLSRVASRLDVRTRGSIRIGAKH